MNKIKSQIRIHYLLKLKKIIDQDKNGDKFILARRDKNIKFMREYSLNNENIKDIIRNLTIEDCFAGPEDDRNSKFKGWIFKFNPRFEDIKLYIKIRIENIDKSVCLSIHEFGKYDRSELK